MDVLSLMAFTDVMYETDGPVATISLNRPDRLNAATFDMGQQLQEALRQADADPDIRCIVLTGKGRGFCAGDDVQAAWGDPRMEATVAELGSERPPLTPEVRAFLELGTPIIAAVNGVAIGIGMDMAIQCDIVVAAEEARFSQGYVRMGLMCDVGGLTRLPQLVGPMKAAELLLTGATIDAAEALRIGLVVRVVPADDLLAEVNALANKIAANPPLAVRHIKEGLRRGLERRPGDFDDLAAYVGGSLSRLFQTADHHEAAAAFMEKRPGVFTGK